MNENIMVNLKIDEETLPLISRLGELLPGGFFVYHAFGTQELICFNSKMVQLFGCETDDEFRALVGNSFKGIVHFEEYGRVESSIRRQISDSADQMDHVTYRFIRRDGSIGMMDDYGHFSHSETLGDIYYVFVQDISMQYEEDLEKERIARQQRRELISLLTGSESTYIVYPDTDRFMILGQNQYLKDHYSADESFTQSLTRYIETDVYEPDRALAKANFALDRIAARLNDEKQLSFRFRDISSGTPRWYELQAARLSNQEILCSFTDVDEAVTSETVYEKLKENYFGLYCIDLDSGLSKIIRSGHPELTGEVGTSTEYRQVIQAIASASKGETVEFLHKISSMDYLKERFREDDVAYYYYPSHIFEENRWISVTGRVLQRKANGTPELFGLGFSLMDALSSEREQIKAEALKAHMREDIQMIGGLASEYYALYYYNISEEKFSVYALDKERFPQAAGMVDAGGDPLEILRRFGTSQLIHPDDRAAFAHLDSAFIQDVLAHDKKHSIRFRRVFGGEYRWVEMDFIKYEDNDEPANAIAIGFTERDQAIRTEEALNSAYAVLNKEYMPDDAIDKLLAIAGEFYDADRCYIFEDRKSRKTIDNTYEWCAGGIEAEIDKLQNIPVEVCAGWYEEFAAQGTFFMDALDSEHNTPEAIELLKMQGIDSLIAAPIYAGEDIIGYIGVDNPKKAKHDIAILQSIANVAYSQMLERNELKGQNAFNSFFLEPYLSAYYVGLEDKSCIVFKRTQQLKEKYPILSDYLDDINKYIDSDVHPDDREMLKNVVLPKNLRASLLTQDQFSVIYRDITAEEHFYRMQVIKGGDGDHAVLGFADVTDEIKKQKEEELIRSMADQQRHIKAFGNMINAGLWSMIIGEDHNLKEVYWSNEFRRMFGYEENEEDFPNRLESWSDLLHSDDKARVMAGIHDSFRKTETDKYAYDVEYRILRKSGEYCWYHALGRMENIGGGDRRLYGIIVDISAEKELEKKQKQLAEALSMAESANRAKTTFLNNMSHDIRTPMNAIIGYTGLAASHIDNKAQVQDYLGKIAQSSDHLLSLINDVLDMSRIESGKMNLDEKPENLPDIIHTLRNIVQADIYAKRHDFYIDTVNVNDENIICDKLRLNQVLLNILSNSIKYTAAGGTISMRITEKAVKASGYATYEFLIKDNGMGMEPEFVKKIFDPFTRVNSSTISGIQGTGLGMAITKNIIDMLGGRIEIASELGKGTETTITFDFKLSEARKENFEIPELKGVRALIADDDANTCVSIENMLSEIGMRSEWCTSGKEAVFRAENAYRRGDLFKVYIIDWLMPDMNGIETTRRIRRSIGDDVPIIILTAYDWSDIEEEARAAGVTAFVSKPMFMSDLNKVLRACLGQEKEAASLENAGYDFAGKKILLVEDNELNREIATEILKEDGFVIDAAEDGTIAVERMKAAQPGDYDLILMDIQMPIMDGHEAARQIRALNTEISGIPIIAMTANAFEEDRKAALEAGMNEHIAKPIDVKKLKTLLAKYL